MLTLEAVVTNNGMVTSDHSVLFFAAPPSPGQGGDPIQSLVGFGRTGMLGPGQSATVSVTLSAYELSLADQEGSRAARKGTWAFMAGSTKVNATVI